jgi:hypothetical protein
MREQLRRQQLPARIGFGERLHAAAFFFLPASGEPLQRRQCPFEGLSCRVVLLDVGGIRQHQVAAQMELHAQQRFMRLGRCQRRRCPHRFTDLDVAGGVAARHEGQCHDQQGQSDEDAEADRQFGADARLRVPEHAAHAPLQKPRELR